MKHFYLLMLSIAFTLSGKAQSDREFINIYRNDGSLNAFSCNVVDSITYSHYDTDSIFYDEIVTQLVYTPDSVYFMPLVEIDSISFVQSSYTCPDANHPHWIDLGLPSGTLWRCCNEGASTPEAYGGYYTFRQVSSAPTLDQIEEILNNTTSEWTTQNGVKGRKFVGPNGGTIFLPAAGFRWYGEFYYVGSYGYYWSSTLFENYQDNACSLYFYSRSAYWSDYYRDYEQSVRPVR